MSKVCIWGPGSKFTSGITYYTRRLGTELEKSNIVSYVLFNDLLPKCLFPGRERIGRLKDDNPIPNRTVDWWNPLSLIESILFAYRSDSIVFEWWSSSVGIEYLIAAILLRKKNLVIEYHEYVDPGEMKNPLLRYFTKGCLWGLSKLCTRGVFHSRYEESMFPENLKPRETSIIPHGVYDQYNVDRIPHDTFNILFFGLVREYKGLEYLIDAFEMSDNKDWHLDVVGEEWDPIDIPDDNRIHWHKGYASDEHVENFFNLADVVVLPYTRASQSGVSFIAMHYGLPIIYSDVGGLAETLSMYSGGYRVEPKNSGAIYEALRFRYENPKAAGSYTAPGRFKWENIARLWNDIL